MKLYSIYNALTETFNPPFVARDDTDAMEMVRKAIIGGRDISLLVELNVLSLKAVGFFDATTGCFEDDPHYQVVSLDDIKLPEHVQTLIAKLKEVKEDQ